MRLAYAIISNYYGDLKTKRSEVRLMNHIDEGIEILKKLNANENVIDAYCLHPILQSDEAFNTNIDFDFTGINSHVLFLVIEYRRVANSYLSNKNKKDFVGFTNEEIRLMLYADKVQNEKDFKLYHENTHPRSKELREYFDNWFEILGIEK